MRSLFGLSWLRGRAQGWARWALLVAVLGLAGCASSIDPKVYQAEKPVLDLKEYFNGTIDAWGVFQDRSGKVVRRFTVVMKCTWVGDTGTLDEDFVYSDGTKEKRVWTIKKLPDGRYTGTASDVIGQANGQASGNALYWSYALRLKVDGKEYDVNFDDWMFQMDDKTMLNRAVMSKFGFHLGEVFLSFRKR
jgi:hypothetical protein